MKKRDFKLSLADQVFTKIFDKAAQVPQIEQVLDGCHLGSHKFHRDGVCRGCGRHKLLVTKRGVK